MVMVVEEEGLLDRINSNRVLPVVVVVMVAEVVGFKASSNRLVAVVAVEEGFTAIKLVVAVVLVAEVEGFKASTNSNLVVVVAEVVAVEVVLVTEGFNRSNKNNNCGPKRETPLPPPSKLTSQLGLQSFLQPLEPTIRTLIQILEGLPYQMMRQWRRFHQCTGQTKGEPLRFETASCM